ncbi:Nitrate reductase cytochrome c-type subunit [Hahella chejuensis KCTC 2396]|uniref:Periplasmic nitrate reductase, electron transfer subunit n=1 Tax=Hahella chejuensis (strain KCTC 2396) TaxID=349521 RepID=Q2SGV6_HAHCH|nr:nitrate reductase cytochrome c-type subunit [Hahella chejuensis]ABC30118.1 Nitrate reductase cytochrome c-type subunit [Hahella chejuensis KCTC 2396]
MKKWLILLALPVITALVWAENIATLRNAPLDENPEPPYIPQVLNEDIKRERAYPMQPPTIPHKIDNYQVDLNNNQCMHCHSRHRIEISQAPMVSVTHYMDREGNFLAEVSPRRYFCNQCHVPQTNAKPLVENNFKDIRQIIQDKRKEQ